MRLQFKDWTTTDGEVTERRASFGPIAYRVARLRIIGWFALHPSGTQAHDCGPERATPAEAESDCEAHLQAIADALDLLDERTALIERDKKSVEYVIQLQRLIESLRHDDTPYPELHHHRIIVETKAAIAALVARAEQAERKIPEWHHLADVQEVVQRLHQAERDRDTLAAEVRFRRLEDPDYDEMREAQAATDASGALDRAAKGGA